MYLGTGKWDCQELLHVSYNFKLVCDIGALADILKKSLKNINDNE